MATVAPARLRLQRDTFRIHEDVPSTEDTQMGEEQAGAEDYEEDDGGAVDDGDDQESNYTESSEETTVDISIQEDMERLQNAYPGFRNRYRLIKRIGEGL